MADALIMRKGGAGGIGNIINGEKQEYYANSGTIDKNTFVEFDSTNTGEFSSADTDVTTTFSYQNKFFRTLKITADKYLILGMEEKTSTNLSLWLLTKVNNEWVKSEPTETPLVPTSIGNNPVHLRRVGDRICLFYYTNKSSDSIKLYNISITGNSITIGNLLTSDGIINFVGVVVSARKNGVNDEIICYRGSGSGSSTVTTFIVTDNAVTRDINGRTLVSNAPLYDSICHSGEYDFIVGHKGGTSQSQLYVSKVRKNDLSVIDSSGSITVSATGSELEASKSAINGSHLIVYYRRTSGGVKIETVATDITNLTAVIKQSITAGTSYSTNYVMIPIDNKTFVLYLTGQPSPILSEFLLTINGGTMSVSEKAETDLTYYTQVLLQLDGTNSALITLPYNTAQSAVESFIINFITVKKYYKTSITKIDGVTISKATPNQRGKVWVLA